MPNTMIVAVSLAVFGCVLYVIRRPNSAHPLPPGPPGLPWVGSVMSINTSAPLQVTYADWARRYGDMVYSRLMGKDVIIINSEKIAKDLFEKRSSNYSDRPYLAATKMYGVAFSTATMLYGNQWRMHRRLFHQTFRLDAVPRFIPVHHRKACHLLRQLLNSPEQLGDHVFEYTASVILNNTYDYDPVSRKDKIMDIAANTLAVLTRAFRPDVTVVTNLLVVLNLPSWLPGVSFKKDMEMVRTTAKEYVERTFEYSLRKAEMHSISPSLVHDGLQIREGKGSMAQRMVALKEAAATAFLAASDSSDAVLLTFVLLMMLNPDAQEKAQAQIDVIVGKDKLPAIEDRPLLPFVDAILRETLRYNPPAPLQFPHASLDDDVYEGFRIPKGAIIMVNAWSIAHNESRFPNPHAFIPERFLNDDGSLKSDSVEHILFGFGRRICPGRHLADVSLWAVMAKVLAVFKILKPLDENGVEITIPTAFSSGATSHPLPFECRFVPRFPGLDVGKLEELIAASTP